MDYNLTEEQLALIIWFGEQIYSRRLSPVFRIRFSTNPAIKGPYIDGQIVKTDYKGNYHPSIHPTIARDALVTLGEERLLFYTISQRSSPSSTNKTIIYKCRFLERASEIIGTENEPVIHPDPPLTPERITMVRLDQGVFRQLLTSYFSREELKNLCFDVGLDYDSLPGGLSKGATSREILSYATRSGLILSLIVTAYNARPNSNWSNILISG